MRELRTAAIAVVVMTLVLGLAYPLAMTGVSQLLFPNKADGSIVKHNGKAVGSKLIGQDFSKDPSLFQSRPSVTTYNPAGTFFNNQGPNQKDLATQLQGFVKDYLKRERPYTRNLTAAQIPPDAVTTSASGVDPQISVANARIQANRVAKERNLPLDRVMQIVDDHTSRPLFGLGGPKSINVLEANLALDEVAQSATGHGRRDVARSSQDAGRDAPRRNS
jgi:potassium-transporting ATPase KdpC subunit